MSIGGWIKHKYHQAKKKAKQVAQKAKEGTEIVVDGAVTDPAKAGVEFEENKQGDIGRDHYPHGDET